MRYFGSFCFDETHGLLWQEGIRFTRTDGRNEHDWHPVGRKNSPRSEIRDSVNPASTNWARSGVYACLHFSHS